MKPVVRFEEVSKKYNLGLTRTSLPTLISQWLKQPAKHLDQKSAEDQVLWALRRVSFEVFEGQSFALVGPNGAGKTTILKLLAQITKPTAGQITVSGQLSALIELGAGFHPDLSGRENIYLNGSILGLRRKDIERRFDEIVAFSELERFIDTPVKRYSSGMTVRLGFAVASCMEPDILLVDEVLAVGDVRFRQKCLDRIQALVSRGTSVIFVSHNSWLVQSVCTSGIYINRGEVKFCGDISEVISAYDRTLNEERAQKLELAQTEPNKVATDIEITKVVVLRSQGDLTNELRNDQPAEVQLHYVAYRPFHDVTVVIRIVRSDGLTCCMMRSRLDKAALHFERGAGVVAITLDPLQLRGGAYYVQAIIRDANDSVGIAEMKSEWFYVTGSLLTYSDLNGVFEPNRRWAHYQDTMPLIRHSSQESQLVGATQFSQIVS